MTTPDPEYPPVAMHLASAAPGVTVCGQRARKALRTDFGSETVDDTNRVRPLLPAAPGRRIAHVQATGGDVWLCDSEAKAKAATPEGSVLPSANTGPWPVHGTNAVWIVQKTATNTCVVSFTAEYETGAGGHGQ